MATVSSAGSPGYRWARVDIVIGAAILSSVVFVILVAGPTLTTHWARHGGHEALLLGHIGGGAGMLLFGAVGLRIGLTRQGFAWHRIVGAAYLVTGTLASTTALILSFDVPHTPGISTGTLAVVWLAFTAMAVRAIRNRRVEQHREWMIRSYVVAWTFVFCRFYSRAMPDEMQLGLGDMIWLTWVAPVLLAEILLQWRRGSPVSAGRG
jgi:uncharacterized membrane protein